MRDMHSASEVRNEIAMEIMHVARKLMQRTARAMENLNVGMGQLPILKLLSERATMTQRQLAEEIRITPATVCGTLKRMERAGLVQRTAAQGDARVSCVSLTDKGRMSIREAETAIQQPYGDMMSGFSEEECRMLCDFARRMGENLERKDEEQPNAYR